MSYRVTISLYVYQSYHMYANTELGGTNMHWVKLLFYFKPFVTHSTSRIVT